MGCPQEQSAVTAQVPVQATAPALSQKTAATPAPGAQPGMVNLATPSQTAAADSGTASATPKTMENSPKARALVGRAEATYRSGVSNYTAGHLDAARKDFDSAVDMMLTSGMDLKNDTVLADEFDHLLNAVNSLELAALKQGNGLSPTIEEAPLEAANDVTFPPNAELTAKLTAELKTTQSDFPLVVNNYVAGFISYFSNSQQGHAHLLRSLERAGKYKGMIQKILAQEGVPQDLIYLAVAESGFQPQALNARSGAGGMWQFMPTGAYGLTRNGWVDERFDPEKSSRAYARYIKSLYNQFGDWYLAMAAYDWGPGYVQRAVMKTGYADFWELYRRNALPAETKNYVPGIIAAIIMAKNPQQYGLDKLVPESAVVSDTVTVDSEISLPLVADLTNASVQEVVALNPSLLRMTTPNDVPFDLHLPVGTKDIFAERVKEIPADKRANWRFHVVRSGESVETIAVALRSRAAAIEDTNGIAAGDSVAAGDELVVPVVASANGTHPQRYALRRGDTLVTVADRFNVSVEDLRRWNHLSTNTLGSRRVLYVAEPLRLAPRGRGRSRAPRAGSRAVAASAARSSASRSPSPGSSAAKARATTAAASGAAASHAKKQTLAQK